MDMGRPQGATQGSVVEGGSACEVGVHCDFGGDPTGLAHRSYAQAQPPVAVRAAYIPVVTWLPAWVAKEKGFFAAHGLDVTLSVAQNLSTLPGTVGKQFEFVPSTAPDLLKSVASGLTWLPSLPRFLRRRTTLRRMSSFRRSWVSPGRKISLERSLRPPRSAA